ncbi:hypothetical protein GCM10011392_04040 [Wenxinia marina]|nr:hypothetical protein GCM10011392_04040 [Wenxinia marina]
MRGALAEGLIEGGHVDPSRSRLKAGTGGARGTAMPNPPRAWPGASIYRAHPKHGAHVCPPWPRLEAGASCSGERRHSAASARSPGSILPAQGRDGWGQGYRNAEPAPGLTRGLDPQGAS